jgi:hypothetical protein
MVTRWYRKTEGTIEYQSPITYKQLAKNKSPNSKDRFQANPVDIPSFHVQPSTSHHFKVVDTDGNILLYRYRYHDPDGSKYHALALHAASLPYNAKHYKPKTTTTLISPP